MVGCRPSAVVHRESEAETATSLKNRLLEVMRQQKAVEVPHETADGSMRVVRLEPDGIHVRTSSSIRKIQMEDMTESLLETYHIDSDTGAFYREVQENKREKRRHSAAQYAAEQRAAEVKRRDAAKVKRAQQQRAVAARQVPMARRQWAAYDRNYRQYLAKKKEKERARRNGKSVTMPMAPKKPRVPRP
jgi:hypothetical protein